MKLDSGKITDPTDSDRDSDPTAWLGMMENMCITTSVKAVEYRLEDKSTCLKPITADGRYTYQRLNLSAKAYKRFETFNTVSMGTR